MNRSIWTKTVAVGVDLSKGKSSPDFAPTARVSIRDEPYSPRTLTKVDLCEAVYQKVGLSRTESSVFVELVLKEITDCLEKGETVRLSSFGSFMVRKKGQRIGRNPMTGAEVPISPRRVMVFKPSAVLLKRVSAGVEKHY
jgi:integration host factor subunit alpha